MRALALQGFIEIKLQLRRREVVFFSLLLPVLFLLFFGALYGNQVTSSGRSYIDYIVPGYAVYAIMSVALVTLAINVATERQFGILKRLGGTPLPRASLVAAKIISGALLAAAVIVVLVVLGITAYHAQLRGNMAAAILVLIVGILSFAAMGITFGGIVKPDSAAAAANLISLTFAFLGGVFIPLDQFPETLRNIAQVLPSERLNDALQAIWTKGQGLGATGSDLLVVALWAAAALALGARRFRWE
jgi:ABC-2 type transport system permease protein